MCICACPSACVHGGLRAALVAVLEIMSAPATLRDAGGRAAVALFLRDLRLLLAQAADNREALLSIEVSAPCSPTHTHTQQNRAQIRFHRGVCFSRSLCACVAPRHVPLPHSAHVYVCMHAYVGVY
jgi:hypothetical protein